MKKATQEASEREKRSWMLVRVVTHQDIVAHTAADHFDLMDQRRVSLAHPGPQVTRCLMQGLRLDLCALMLFTRD